MRNVLLALMLTAGLCAGVIARADSPEAVTVPVSGGRTLAAQLYRPAGGAPAPAVLVLHTGFGSVETADAQYAADLAAAGFVALAVNYLHPEVTANRTRFWSPAITKDLVEVVDWLQARPEVAGKPVGAVGFSLGSHAILLSARQPAIKAVVVYYGAYDARTLRGLTFPPGVRMPVEAAAEVQAPALLLHGEADDEIPLSDARGMQAALAAAGKTVELVTYPGVYHRFDRGKTTAAKSRYTYVKDEAATKDAFARTLAWLRKYLVSP